MKQKNIIILTVIVIIGLAAGIFWYFKNTSKAPEEKIGLGREKIGVGITFTDPQSIEKYQAVLDYLNKYSDDDWYLVPLKDYGSFISQMKLGQIKAGFMGSAIAYRMLKEGLALPVARGEKNSISVYYGYIFTRKDSGLNTIEDLKDKKFAYVDPYTSAGYFFPQFLLKEKGLNSDSFFRVSSFLGSHKNAILAVLNGEYDGGAAKDVVWRELSSQNPNLEKELQIIATEGPFPEQTFMVVTDSASEVEELRGLLLKLTDSEEGRLVLTKFNADRFIITQAKDFETVEKIMR
ncbi:MAG: phosphate/phosphite/phosphonate ABC transporter substrate-binding protein [bacterium]|nr:phosphate/phosphite/phosphonate ABC transporter substrate-binding protein [bacterium]